MVPTSRTSLSQLPLPFALAVFALLPACATAPFAPGSIAESAFVRRAISQTQSDLRISASVVEPGEAQTLMGIDLYEQGIQPLWLQAENRSEQPARIALASIDAEYFPPFEVAWANRKAFRKEDRAALERWLYENRMPRWIPPGETHSGFLFTHMTEGTRTFNADVYVAGESSSFTFFVPTRGLAPDYMNVDLAAVYSDEQIRSFALGELPGVLEAHDCCSTDETGEQTGDPFNVVVVGSAAAVRRSLLRAGWSETERTDPTTAIARRHRYRGRVPDGTFLKERPDGDERKELRVWLAPLRFDDTPVWLAQARVDVGIGSAAGTRRVDPDIDAARMFVMQDFLYAQSVTRLGFVGGVPIALRAAPRRDFNGSEYVTDGRRAVLFVTESPVALDEVTWLEWPGATE